MPELSERIVKRVERKFDKGENHFAARGMLASIALGLAEPQVRDDTLLDSNERIVRMMAERGAAGIVYAVREDLGSGKQDSTDFVYVRERNGVATNAKTETRSGTEIIIRASTDQIDY